MGGFNPNNPAEKELIDQIASIKNRTQTRSAASAPVVER